MILTIITHNIISKIYRYTQNKFLLKHLNIWKIYTYMAKYFIHTYGKYIHIWQNDY